MVGGIWLWLNLTVNPHTTYSLPPTSERRQISQCLIYSNAIAGRSGGAGAAFQAEIAGVQSVNHFPFHVLIYIEQVAAGKVDVGHERTAGGIGLGAVAEPRLIESAGIPDRVFAEPTLSPERFPETPRYRQCWGKN